MKWCHLILILLLSLFIFNVNGAENENIEIGMNGEQSTVLQQQQQRNTTKKMSNRNANARRRPPIPLYYLNLKQDTYYEDVDVVNGAIQFKHPIHSFVSRGLQLHVRLEVHRDFLPTKFLDISPLLSLQLTPIALNCTSCQSIPSAMFAINTKTLPIKQISHTFTHPTAGAYILEAKLFFREKLILAHNSTGIYHLYGNNAVSDQELFEKWLRINGAVLHTHVATFTEGPFEYRGLAASKNIASGTPVISVPSKLTISYHSIRQTPFAWIYPDFDYYYQENQIMPLFLVYCTIFHEECSYYPYILSLPKFAEMPKLPIRYRTQDLDLFNNTVYVEDLEVRRNSDLERRDEIIKLLKDVDAFYPALFDDHDNGEKTARQYVTWAMTMVHSRAWGTDATRFGANSVLIPYLDLANHQNDAPFMNTKIANYMSIHANQDLKVGDQFFDNYGQEKMFNNKLIYYGYLDMKDQVYVVLDLYRMIPQFAAEGDQVDHNKQFDQRMKILQQINGEWDELEALRLIYGEEELAKNVLLGMRIFALNDTDIGNQSAKDIAEKITGNPNLIFNLEQEKYALRLLDEFLEQYFKLNEEITDEKCNEVLQSQKTSMLEKAAAKVRIEERKILKWFSSVVQGHKRAIGLD